MSGPLWRIGELSRRVGVSAATLRAWEERYGLLRPQRSAGNYRLYGPDDEDRVRRVLAHIAEGMSTAEAARLVAGGPSPVSSPPAATDAQVLGSLRAELLAALERFDDPAAQAALDRLFALVSHELALAAVVLPVLHDIGERWARGEITVAEEHYATSVVQARLQALSTGWQQGSGPAAVLACVPGELHSLGLACLGLGLRARGWTVLFLGQDTPVAAIERAAERVRARAVVLAAVMADPLVRLTDDPPRLAEGSELVLAGRAASAWAADRLGARLETGDPLEVADSLTTGLLGRPR